MSLCLVLQSKDSIILASDSRATIGDPRGMTTSNDTVKKVFQISKKIGLVIAGSGDVGYSLVEMLRPKMTEETDADMAIETCRATCLQAYREWFPTSFQPIPSPQGVQFIPRPDVLITLAGFTAEKIPKIVILNSQVIFNFAPQPTTMGFSAIGVVPLAVYLLNRLFKPDAPAKVVKELAAYCILETASQDGKVGGPIQVAEIMPFEGFRDVVGKELNEVLKAAEAHRNKLRDSFYEGR